MMKDLRKVLIEKLNTNLETMSAEEQEAFISDFDLKIDNHSIKDESLKYLSKFNIYPYQQINECYKRSIIKLVKDNRYSDVSSIVDEILRFEDTPSKQLVRKDSFGFGLETITLPDIVRLLNSEVTLDLEAIR